MISNLLTYVVTDVFFQMAVQSISSNPALMSSAAPDREGTARILNDNGKPIIIPRSEMPEELIAAFNSGFDAADLPDEIRIRDTFSFSVHPDTGMLHSYRGPSVDAPELELVWGERRDGKFDYHRDDGYPCSIKLTGLRQRHQNGVLHRKSSAAIQCRNLAARWGTEGRLFRDDGPFKTTITDIKAFVRDGEIQHGFSYAGIHYDWNTSQGRRIGVTRIEDVMKDNSLKFDPFLTKGFFPDPQEEFIFQMELGL